ncbi:ABC transporter permease [Bacteroides sp. 519]|uniref:ABC transporter permease n=1 Tax=Bacteroides sp. 519 TaxID=2302937 RepID=UPI0013D33DC5|nr:ABC transporter permease [Bacteroides sp. 519]NDV59875.1 ABC transporter permease [Bacteroides sp. 519]
MKIYFKQAIQILKQNKLMSIIAILGTALAIMMIMTIIVSEEIKNISVAPEINRNTTFYLSREVQKDTLNNSTSSGYIGYAPYRDYLSQMKTPQYVSALTTGVFKLSIPGMEELNVYAKLTDEKYWNLFAFTFIEGRGYTAEEFASGVKYAVVSQSTARKVAKGENILGKDILLNNIPYRVIGIVKDVPHIFRNAYAPIWLPYTSVPHKQKAFSVFIKAKDKKDFPAIYAETREAEQKFNADNKPLTIAWAGPYNHKTFAMQINANNQEELKSKLAVQYRKKIFIFIILLLVPAINLSGFSLSRIKKRMSEIGVRKAFGAKKYVILMQVLYENFITSLIGGILGLLASYLVIYHMRTWLLDIPTDSNIPINTLVSPWIFIAVFGICVIINLLSAGLPAWKASRLPITNSINQNDREV